jgi:hypothetical protein
MSEVKFNKNEFKRESKELEKIISKVKKVKDVFPLHRVSSQFLKELKKEKEWELFVYDDDDYDGHRTNHHRGYFFFTRPAIFKVQKGYAIIARYLGCDFLELDKEDWHRKHYEELDACALFIPISTPTKKAARETFLFGDSHERIYLKKVIRYTTTHMLKLDEFKNKI